MKGLIGIFVFGIAGFALFAYVAKENTNTWVIIPLFILVGLGFELVISDRVDTKIEELKEELRDEFGKR